MAITFGSDTLIANITQSDIAVCKIDATHAIIVYADTSAGDGNAVIATISGTSVSFGTPNTFASGTLDTNVAAPSLCVTLLDSTHFVVSWITSAGIGRSAVGVFSGTSITSYGTSVNMIPGQTISVGMSMATLDSTRFVISFTRSSSATSRAMVGVVSLGTTITFGTDVQVNGSTTIGSRGKSATCALSSSSFVTVVAKYATVSTVSVAVITGGSEATWFNNTFSNVSVDVLDSTHYIVAGADPSSAGKVVAASVSGTTSTFGTDQDWSASGANTNWASVSTINATSFFLSGIDNQNSTMVNMVGTVSGTSTTLSVNYPSMTLANTNSRSMISTLDSSHFIHVFKSNADNKPYALVGANSTAINSQFLIFM